MAAYKVVEPSIEKLTEIAYITYQMLWFEDQFRRYKDYKDEEEYLKYKDHLKSWHERNLQKIT
jgi:hypothetical protein